MEWETLIKWSANFVWPHKAQLLSLTPLEFSKSGQDLFTASAFSSCWSSASILQIVRSSFLLPGDISHSGIHQKGNFSFVKNSRDTTHHVMSGGEFEIYSVQELLDLGILIFQWDLFSSCRKARLNVVVEAKNCCVSSPRVPASSHPKSVQPTHNQRQPLKPTYFSTTRLSNQTLVTS